MRPLRYSINVTLDGCCDHAAIMPDEHTHQHATRGVADADALLLGRVTYELMESGWRDVARSGVRPEWMEPWMESFAHAIDAKRKYVVSRTLAHVDWNAELVRDDPVAFVRQLKRQPGKGLAVGGLRLPLLLATHDLIDEYEFVVHQRLAGRGPTLLAGLPRIIDLQLVDRIEFPSGAVALRYTPRR